MSVDSYVQDLRRLVSMSSRGRSMSRGSRGSGSRSRASSRSSRSSVSTLVESRGRRLADNRRLVQSFYFDPFPSMMKNRLRYVENILIGTVAQSDDANIHYLSCNGIHDPSVSGTGHQPYGHDVVASLYNHYRVDKSVITITPSTGGSQVIWGVALTDDTATSVTDNVMQERKLVKYSVMPSVDSIIPQTISMTWKPDLSFPVGGGEQKNLNAAYGSNPGEQMYFALFVRRPLTGLPALALSFNVQIDYFVTSYELKQLAGS